MSNPNPRTDQLHTPAARAKAAATQAGKHRKPRRVASGYRNSAQPHALVQHAIRFPPELYEPVRLLAEQMGVSVSETVVYLVDLALEEAGQ